jgi:hypothetical protein
MASDTQLCGKCKHLYYMRGEAFCRAEIVRKSEHKKIGLFVYLPARTWYCAEFNKQEIGK